MAIQRLEEVPGVCKNTQCDDFKSFELYDTDEVKSDEVGDYVICYSCKYKIYLD